MELCQCVVHGLTTAPHSLHDWGWRVLTGPRGILGAFHNSKDLAALPSLFRARNILMYCFSHVCFRGAVECITQVPLNEIQSHRKVTGLKILSPSKGP